MMPATHLDSETLSAYLDGELPSDEQRRAAAHLEGCPVCRERFESLQATVGMVRDLDPLSAPEGLRGAVAGALGRGMPSTGAPAGGAPSAVARAARPQVRDRAGWWLFGSRPGWRPGWRLTGAAVAAVLLGLFMVNLLRGVGPGTAVWRTGQAPEEGTARPPLAGSPGVPGVPGVPERLPAQRGQTPIARGTDQSAAPPPAGGQLVLRRVIRTASLVIEVDDFDSAVRRIIVTAEGAGGFVAASSYTQSDPARGSTRLQGTFVLRVPAPRFASTLTSLEDLGRVQERRVGGQDVSEEFVDLQARVRNLERHEQRLLSFMDRATKVSDLLAIEQELARVRGEIEGLTGRLRLLISQVELATIEVALSQKPEKISGGFWDISATLDRIRTAFLNTLRQILSVAEGAAIVISALTPVVVLAALAWVLVRRIRTRAI